jgi:hypothetical protein
VPVSYAPARRALGQQVAPAAGFCRSSVPELSP